MAEQQSKTGKQRPYAGDKKRREDLSSYVFGKVPPQAVPLEEAVLGAILLDKEALPQVLDVLQVDSFYLDAHQLIYGAMKRLFERSQPIDLLTVVEELRKEAELDAAGGPAYLAELTNKVASAANIEYHSRLISQKFIQRELIRISTQTIQQAFEDTTDVFELLDDAEQGLFAIAQKNMGRSVDRMGALASKILKQLEELKDVEDGLTGVPTGFTEFDRLTNGLQPSDLMILAARPGMGKTSLTLSLAKNAAVDFGKPVAFFSLEMSSLQLAQRIISMEAEISGMKMRNGQLEDYEWQQLHTAIEKVADAPIFIDDTPSINIFELRAKCRRLKLQHDIQIVIIDYLQLMSGGGDNQKGNREQEVSAISRALKSLAKELNVPVIALSQLSRAVEVRGGSKKPQLSDLRESGCLTGDTLLRDAVTGARITIKELAEREVQSPVWIWAKDALGAIRPHQLSRAFYSGRKRIFALRTRGGRMIKASANHPFFTALGWLRLDQLSVAMEIAVTNVMGHPGQRPPFGTAAAGAGCSAIMPAFPDGRPAYRCAPLSFRSSVAASPRLHRGASAILDQEDVQSFFWDEIVSITPLGVEDVYDATVPGVHNFVANDIIVHNSIEQDADMVAFIYRPEYYQILEDEEGQSLKGVAEVIVAKNRHGATKTIRLRFTDEFARFSNLDDPDFSDLPGNTFESSFNNVITKPSKMNDDEDIPF